MNDTMLAVFSGAVQGLADAQKNSLILADAKQRLLKDKEIFTLEKKKAELDIKKMELDDLDPDMIRQRQEELKAKTAAYDAAHALSIIKIDTANREETRKAETHAKEMSLVDKILNGGLNLQPGERFSVGDVSVGRSMPGRSASQEEDFVPPWQGGSASGNKKPPVNQDVDVDDFLSTFK